MVNPVALTIFASYFVVIIGLFTCIVKDLARAKRTNALSDPRHVRLYASLAFCSFLSTWFYMIKFLHWSFMDFESRLQHPPTALLERLSLWLSSKGLFEEAWTIVRSRVFNWWWGEQLCLFTAGSWTLFLAVKGREHRVPRLWVYMLLGQLVAISVALNLFSIALVLHPLVQEKETRRRQVPASLWASIFIALFATAGIPFTNDQTFLPILLLIHVAAIWPLFGNSSYESSRYSISLNSFVSISYMMCLAIRVRTLFIASDAVKDDPHFHMLTSYLTAFQALYSHPAQSSLSWDVIWTTISVIVWCMQHAGPFGGLALLKGSYLVFGSLFLSIGVIAPKELLSNEEHRGEINEKHE